MTPDKPEKVIEILSVEDELSMIDLRKKLGMGNLNSFIDLINKMEEREIIKTRTEGRKRLVRLCSPIASTNYFIENYPNRLKSLKKSLEKELKALEKNLPLVSNKLPLKKVKIKRPVLELDKKTNVRRDMGKTEDDYAYTFKTRPTAEKQFVKILDLNYKIYQESSALNFAESIIDNPKLIKIYQERSEKMIKEVTDNISKMLLKHDPNSIVYANYRLRNVLHGLVFKATLKEEMESKKAKLDSKSQNDDIQKLKDNDDEFTKGKGTYKKV